MPTGMSLNQKSNQSNQEGDCLILQCDTNMVATEQNCGTSSSFDVSRGKVCEL